MSAVWLSACSFAALSLLSTSAHPLDRLLGVGRSPWSVFSSRFTLRIAPRAVAFGLGEVRRGHGASHLDAQRWQRVGVLPTGAAWAGSGST